MWVGAKVGCVGRAGAGYVRAMLAASSRETAMAGGFRGRGKEAMCRILSGNVIALRDALAGGFRGRGKEAMCRILLGNATADC